MKRWHPWHCTDGTLVALLDDELELHEQTAARRHMSECDRCSNRLEQQQDANAVLIGLLARDESLAQPVPADRRHLAGGIAGAGLLVASVGALVAAGIVVHRRRHHTIAGFGNGRS